MSKMCCWQDDIYDEEECQDKLKSNSKDVSSSIMSKEEMDDAVDKYLANKKSVQKGLKTKKNNIAFCCSINENIIFNAKLNKFSKDDMEEDTIDVKLDVTIKDEYLLYSDFKEAMENLGSIVLNYTPMVYKLDNSKGFIEYNKDRGRTLEPINGFSLKYEIDANGLINLQKIYITVSSIYRYSKGSWDIDENLIYNRIIDLINSTDKIKFIG